MVKGKNLSDNKKTKTKTVKSKVVMVGKPSSKIKEHNTAAEFEEEGVLINMEINDGGAAAAEFASEEEIDQHETNEESESDSDSDEEQHNSIGNESGEIVTTQSESDLEDSSDGEMSQHNKDKLAKSPVAKKKRKDAWKSIEDRLDTMSSSLLAMTELLKQNGIITEPSTSKIKEVNPSKELKKGKSEPPVELTETTSETTIYQNAVAKLNETSHREIVVDPEITL